MPESTSRPRRRWFQFSLASFFVVTTLFAVWLGWELKFVRARRATIQSFADQQRGMIVLLADFKDLRDIASSHSVPFWRRGMGDEAVVVIGYFDANLEEIKTAVRIFPEAKILMGDTTFTPEIIKLWEAEKAKDDAVKPVDKTK